MSVVDQRILLPNGQQLDVSELTVNGSVVERERHGVADPEEAAAIAKVRNEEPFPSDYGLVVRVVQSSEPDWGGALGWGPSAIMAPSFAAGFW